MTLRVTRSFLGTAVVIGFAYLDSHGVLLRRSSDPVLVVLLVLVLGLGLQGWVIVETRFGKSATFSERCAMALGLVVTVVVVGRQCGFWLITVRSIGS